MNFAKKLFLGSVVAMSSFGLIACGDSSSSSGTEDQDQPENIVVPTQKDANITVSPDIGSSEAGNNMRFKGRFGLDVTVDSSETRDQIQFTKITYSVGKGNDINNMPPVNVTVQSNPITFPSGNDIDLNSQVPGIGAGVIIDMKDPGFTECGTYSLIVTVNASDDPVGAPEKYSRTEVIPFERNPNMFCREPESSSGTEPVKQEVTMTSCVIEGLSTNLAPGINFATCQPADAATADIVFAKAGSKDEPDMSVSGNNGIVFVELGNHIGDVNPEDFADNYDADSWPEDVNGRSAYVSDFKPRTIEKATLSALIENGSTIYIAKNPAIYNAETGAGMYPFAITYYEEGNNGDFNFSVKIYKVQ